MGLCINVLCVHEMHVCIVYGVSVLRCSVYMYEDSTYVVCDCIGLGCELCEVIYVCMRCLCIEYMCLVCGCVL